MDGKRALRDAIRGHRLSLDERWRREASVEAQWRIAAIPEVLGASVVLCYLAMDAEVRTDRIVSRCWQRGVEVCVPCYREETGGYGIARLTPRTRLVDGFWGVLEPQRPEWRRIEDVGCVIVPGLAFDGRGGRLGHGAGHYDRLLSGAGAPGPFKVGLAFDFQIAATVPMAKHDVRMDAVVTESGALRANRQATPMDKGSWRSGTPGIQRKEVPSCRRHWSRE